MTQCLELEHQRDVLEEAPQLETLGRDAPQTSSFVTWLRIWKCACCELRRSAGDERRNFSRKVLTRTDATVDFQWGTVAPAVGVPADNYSVRWTGQVSPRFSGSTTFYTSSDDGVRLWVNGQQLINNWTNHGTTENSGGITLTAGQKYDLKDRRAFGAATVSETASPTKISFRLLKL